MSTENLTKPEKQLSQKEVEGVRNFFIKIFNVFANNHRCDRFANDDMVLHAQITKIIQRINPQLREFLSMKSNDMKFECPEVTIQRKSSQFKIMKIEVDRQIVKGKGSWDVVIHYQGLYYKKGYRELQKGSVGKDSFKFLG